MSLMATASRPKFFSEPVIAHVVRGELPQRREVEVTGPPPGGEAAKQVLDHTRVGSRASTPTSAAGTTSAGFRTSRSTGCWGRRAAAACASTGRDSHRAPPTRTARCTGPGPGSGKRAPAAPERSPRAHESTAASSNGATAAGSATTRRTSPPTPPWSTDLPGSLPSDRRPLRPFGSARGAWRRFSNRRRSGPRPRFDKPAGRRRSPETAIRRP